MPGCISRFSHVQLPESSRKFKRLFQIDTMYLGTACRLKLHYGQSLADIDFDQQIATFESDSGAKQSVSYSLLVGADGRRSKVREHLEGRDSQMYHKEFVAERSYKGFHRLPALGLSCHKESKFS